MKAAEIKNHLLAKMRGFASKRTPGGHLKFQLYAGLGPSAIPVCRAGFKHAYVITNYLMDELVSCVRNGMVTIGNKVEEASSGVLQFAKQFNINVDTKKLALLSIPNSVASMVTSAWMSYYFDLVGDHAPDADDKILLEAIPKAEVFKEYECDMQSTKQSPVTLALFLALWRKVYSHVSVRKYKSSCGHCHVCATLGEQRRKFKCAAGRIEVSKLFSLHRLSAAAERKSYYDRRNSAYIYAHLFYSDIADGMQQNHNMLPWYGNRKFPGSHVKQHLQGLLTHGRKMRVYRSFCNIRGGANLSIHTWLLSLEECYIKEGKLPDTVYHQIDGGRENANNHMLTMSQLLVSRGLCKKLVLTRLLVGHTHEDIDALFALIWKSLRDQYILTPSTTK